MSILSTFTASINLSTHWFIHSTIQYMLTRYNQGARIPQRENTDTAVTCMDPQSSRIRGGWFHKTNWKSATISAVIESDIMLVQLIKEEFDINYEQGINEP